MLISAVSAPALSLVLVSALGPRDVEAWSAPDDPQAIVGGAEATTCQFPSAVAILEDDETPVMCTGTLVHPNVISLAAHCINPKRPVVGIGFGEVGQGDVVGPERVVAVDVCVGHPQYVNLGYPDIAYCTLPEAVEDVPITPILAGCEVDVLQVGAEVTIVGFGSTYGEYVDGELETQGVGPKRFTTQTIDAVELDEDEVHLVGPSGSQSACFGDSGGPSLIEMADGTWRVFGAASRLYDPGGFPPPAEPGNFCGVGVTYGVLSTQLPWLEAETGYDLTPCHDGDGNWEASAGCGAFPTAPQTGGGEWSTGCVGGELGGGQPLCEDVAGGSSSGGDESDSAGSGGATTRGGTSDSSTGGPPPGGTDTTGGAGVGTAGGDSTSPRPDSMSSETAATDDSAGGRGTGTTGAAGSSGAGADEDGSEDGCACAAGDPRSGANGLPLAGLLFAFGSRRRLSRGR